MTEIIDLIPTDIRNRWDGTSCRISAPITLGDEPTLVAALYNKDGSRVIVAFDLHEGVEVKKRMFGELEADAVWPTTRRDLAKALAKAKKISKKRFKKVEELAKDIIDAWDLDSLVEYARDVMTESLSTLSKKEFDEEWDNYYGVKES